MLGLVILIFGAITSGLLSVYLYNLKDISFVLLWPYFFGTLISIGFFLSNILGIIVYAISLKNSKASTRREKYVSKILLWIIAIVIFTLVIMYFTHLSYMKTDEYKIEQYIKYYGNNG
jgi:hypothetical protein